MFWTNTKRIIKSGFVNFWRNGVVSLSSILVMIVALFMIGSTILMTAFLNATLLELQDKIDVNVYFVTTADETDILAFKTSLETLPEVARVEYVSKDEALEAFKERHQNDELTLQALNELGDNPLRAVLNIKAHNPSQYDGIAGFLEQEEVLSSETGVGIIDKVNYNDNKVVIERLTKMTNGIERIGFALTVVLILISILITFNTIRLAIYTSREEIAVMRLVGANNQYIRGPFLVEGTLYGIVAALITLALFYPLTDWLKGATSGFYGGIDLFNYYVNNFNQIFLIIMVSGMLLGSVSSFLAVKRYLKG